MILDRGSERFRHPRDVTFNPDVTEIPYIVSLKWIAPPVRLLKRRVSKLWNNVSDYGDVVQVRWDSDGETLYCMWHEDNDYEEYTHVLGSNETTAVIWSVWWRGRHGGPDHTVFGSKKSHLAAHDHPLVPKESEKPPTDEPNVSVKKLVTSDSSECKTRSVSIIVSQSRTLTLSSLTTYLTCPLRTGKQGRERCTLQNIVKSFKAVVEWKQKFHTELWQIIQVKSARFIHQEVVISNHDSTRDICWSTTTPKIIRGIRYITGMWSPPWKQSPLIPSSLDFTHRSPIGCTPIDRNECMYPPHTKYKSIFFCDLYPIKPNPSSSQNTKHFHILKF